jgi:hypothetical protein
LSEGIVANRGRLNASRRELNAGKGALIEDRKAQG